MIERQQYTPADAEVGGKKQSNTIEVLNGIDDKTLNGILEVEIAAFPEVMAEDRDELKESLDHQLGVNLVLKSPEGEILGYISSMPLEDTYDFLKGMDPDLTLEPQTLYIKSLAFKPGHSMPLDFLKACRTLAEQAEQRGYKRITAYVRVNEGLDELLQKRGGAKFLHQVENWYGFGEPFDYLEIDLEKDKKES